MKLPPRASNGQTEKQRRSIWDERRGKTAERGYGGDWRKLRKAFIAEHPLCAECERNGKITIAEEVDHVQPITRGGERLDESNLQSLCKSCHSAKTMRELRAK